jgi:hypothetical protein
MPTLTNITVGQFCRELVCGLDELPDLLAEWGLTDQDYRDLRKNLWFQKELKAAVDEVRELGPDSTFIVRCKILSELFLENVVGMMGDRLTPAEVKASLFKQVTELARLHVSKNQINSGFAGPLVTFTFGDGMPGMPKTITVESPALEHSDGTDAPPG